MYWVSVLIVAALSGAHAQLTAQTSVAPELRECYQNTTLIDRNNLPPTTMAVLIDIIRKIEDNPNVNMDLRQLAVLLLHTYRQDGIEFHQPEMNWDPNTVLPFAPTFHSFYRHRLLLTKLIPNPSSQVLAKDTVSSALKCALHHMLSTTVDSRRFGDERNCKQLSEYHLIRTGRSLNDDVESLQPTLFQCPLLGGVVHSPWGAVSAGNLIAGIAAGAESRQVPTSELIPGSYVGHPNVSQTVMPIYPATFSGDLAEAALIQGVELESTVISVGAAGGWNSTQARRFFMLQSRVNLEMTDPEIRGDIDGFFLGSTLTAIQAVYSNLKLSQLLDMYYSPRNGAYSASLRACNRRELSENISNTILTGQTYAFAAALDNNMPLRGSFIESLDQLVSSAVTNFQKYIGNNMNDSNCLTIESTSRDFRLRTNLYIALDASWQYQAVYPAISFLLDAIEVSKFGSSVTLLSAFDGSVIINTTFSLADFHTAYTATRHQALLTGVNLETSLTNIRTLMQNNLENERTVEYVGGNSTVLLYLLNGAAQNNFQVWEQARLLNETVPDLKIIFASATNQFDNLWNLVRNMHDDIMNVSLTAQGTDVEVTMSSVLDRIQQAGRRIINPTCGATYAVDTLSGYRQFDDFVEPGYINFYSISPNYFYRNNDNTRIRIIRTSGETSKLVICHSRTMTQPRQDRSMLGDDDQDHTVTCQTLAATGIVEISLQNACEGHRFINSCPFFYISVQYTEFEGTSAAVYSDSGCRFPYNIRYYVQVQDLGCFSSASGIGASLVFIFAVSVLNLFKWF